MSLQPPYYQIDLDIVSQSIVFTRFNGGSMEQPISISLTVLNQLSKDGSTSLLAQRILRALDMAKDARAAQMNTTEFKTDIEEITSVADLPSHATLTTFEHFILGANAEYIQPLIWNKLNKTTRTKILLEILWIEVGAWDTFLLSNRLATTFQTDFSDPASRSEVPNLTYTFPPLPFPGSQFPIVRFGTNFLTFCGMPINSLFECQLINNSPDKLQRRYNYIFKIGDDNIINATNCSSVSSTIALSSEPGGGFTINPYDESLIPIYQELEIDNPGTVIQGGKLANIIYNRGNTEKAKYIRKIKEAESSSRITHIVAIKEIARYYWGKLFGDFGQILEYFMLYHYHKNSSTGGLIANEETIGMTSVDNVVFTLLMLFKLPGFCTSSGSINNGVKDDDKVYNFKRYIPLTDPTKLYLILLKQKINDIYSSNGVSAQLLSTLLANRKMFNCADPDGEDISIMTTPAAHFYVTKLLRIITTINNNVSKIKTFIDLLTSLDLTILIPAISRIIAEMNNELSIFMNVTNEQDIIRFSSVNFGYVIPQRMRGLDKFVTANEVLIVVIDPTTPDLTTIENLITALNNFFMVLPIIYNTKKGRTNVQTINNNPIICKITQMISKRDATDFYSDIINILSSLRGGFVVGEKRSIDSENIDNGSTVLIAQQPRRRIKPIQILGESEYDGTLKKNTSTGITIENYINNLYLRIIYNYIYNYIINLDRSITVNKAIFISIKSYHILSYISEYVLFTFYDEDLLELLRYININLFSIQNLITSAKQLKINRETLIKREEVAIPDEQLFTDAGQISLEDNYAKAQGYPSPYQIGSIMGQNIGLTIEFNNFDSINYELTKNYPIVLHVEESELFIVSPDDKEVSIKKQGVVDSYPYMNSFQQKEYPIPVSVAGRKIKNITNKKRKTRRSTNKTIKTNNSKKNKKIKNNKKTHRKK
jgi:hypothetical protein